MHSAAVANDPPIAKAENTADQSSGSCCVSPAGEMGLCFMPSSPQHLVWGRLHLSACTVVETGKGRNMVNHTLTLKASAQEWHVLLPLTLHWVKQVTRLCLASRRWERDILLGGWRGPRNTSWARWRLSTQEDLKTCSKSNHFKGGRSEIRIQDYQIF